MKHLLLVSQVTNMGKAYRDLSSNNLLHQSHAKVMGDIFLHKLILTISTINLTMELILLKNIFNLLNLLLTVICKISRKVSQNLVMKHSYLLLNL